MKTRMKSSNRDSLFKNFDFVPTERSLFINKEKFLELIQEMKEKESLSTLRNSIVNMEANLRKLGHDKIGVLNIYSNGDTIEMRQRHLFEQLEQIVESQTLQRAKHYIDRLEKAVTQVRTNKINDINLNRWKEYDDIRTDSLWIIDKRDSTGVHTAGYWGNFIPQIPNQMIKRYTKKGDWILDTFVGCGTTLIESQRLGRNNTVIQMDE